MSSPEHPPKSPGKRAEPTGRTCTHSRKACREIPSELAPRKRPISTGSENRAPAPKAEVSTRQLLSLRGGLRLASPVPRSCTPQPNPGGAHGKHTAANSAGKTVPGGRDTDKQPPFRRAADWEEPLWLAWPSRTWVSRVPERSLQAPLRTEMKTFANFKMTFSPHQKAVVHNRHLFAACGATLNVVLFNRVPV